MSYIITVAGGEGQCGSESLLKTWTMKLSVALFFAGLFGALAAVFILLSFGTDYWLLASENCRPKSNASLLKGATEAVSVGLKTAVDQGEDGQISFNDFIPTIMC